MAEEIKLEALEGERVMLEWIDNLPKLGYVHAVEIPADRDDLLEAARKGWDIFIVNIPCDGEGIVENKRSISRIISRFSLGEIIPFFPLEKLYPNSNMEIKEVDGIPGLCVWFDHFPGTLVREFVAPLVCKKNLY